MLQATDAGTGTQYAMTASYAAMGGLSSVIYGKVTGGFNGITESRSYNNRLEFSSISATSSAGTPLNLSYCYYGWSSGSCQSNSSNNGNVTAIANNNDTGRTETVTYDPLNRIASALSQATSGSDCWGQGFTIDGLANLYGISSQQCSSGTLSAGVNSNNQLTSTGYSYDSAGNMTAEGSSYSYSFDAENRLTTASGGGVSGGPYTYVYDGNSLRVKKSNSAGGTLYWRSLSGNAIAETDLNGNATNEYVFFVGRRIAAARVCLRLGIAAYDIDKP
jgi:hypothetical protein